MVHLGQIIAAIADILKSYDNERPIHRETFKPGIGPLPERYLCKRITEELNRSGIGGQDLKVQFSPTDHPDLAIAITGSEEASWALELKLARPYRDNGKREDAWLKRLLDPYVGNSLLSDARLLAGSDPMRSLDGDFQNKAVVVIGYEHDPPEADLDEIFAAVEILAQHLYGVTLDKAGGGG